MVGRFWKDLAAGRVGMSHLRRNSWIALYPSATPFIHQAIEEQRLDFVDFAIELGASLEQRDSRGMTALHFLISRANPPGGSEELRWSYVQKLLDAGARPGVVNYDCDPIWCGHNIMSQERLRWLVKIGAKVNTVNKAGHASLLGLMNVSIGLPSTDQSNGFRVLVEAGADVNGGKVDYCPLSVALQHGRRDAADFLVAHGADAMRRDHVGRGMLHFARGEVMVNWLLGHGHQVDMRDDFGRTPLLHTLLRAVESQSNVGEETIAALVRAGADLDAEDDQRIGRSPRQIISIHGDTFPALIEILRSADVRQSVLGILRESDSPVPRR